MSIPIAPDPVLIALGGRLRFERDRQRRSQAEVAAAAELSVRFLASVEAGRGNLSIRNLFALASALHLTTSDLVHGLDLVAKRSEPRLLALLGLRGAGKTTLGSAVARELGVKFLEHDDLVETAAGMPLAELFALEGDAEYRRLGREVIDRLVATLEGPVILATSGGIVADDEAFELLRRSAKTVWLKAEPEDHWSRVVAQGDRRPMYERPRARDDLLRLLARRAPQYARANETVDTSALLQLGAKARLRELVVGWLTDPSPLARG